MTLEREAVAPARFDGGKTWYCFCNMQVFSVPPTVELAVRGGRSYSKQCEKRGVEVCDEMVAGSISCRRSVEMGKVNVATEKEDTMKTAMVK